MPEAEEDEDAAVALDAIADELYALAPDEFTAARNARAGTAERSIAARVKALRKPTVAAWAVNLLVRGGQLAEAVELSAALQEAQDDLDATELAQLGRQRRSLVTALAGQAVALASDAGVTVSASARDDIEKTINAAIVDAGAAAAVLTGRLVKPLEAGGFDENDLPEVVGGSLSGVATRAPRDDLAERRARKAAEKAAREAERLENESARELARIEARREKARERLDHLRERIGDLRSELARFEKDGDAAAAALDDIDHEHAEAADAAKAAAARAKAARATLD